MASQQKKTRFDTKHEILVAERATANSDVKKEGQLEERERDYKLRVQTLQHEHSAGMQALEEKLKAITAEHEKQVLVLEGRISDIQASQTRNLITFTEGAPAKKKHTFVSVCVCVNPLI